MISKREIRLYGFLSIAVAGAVFSLIIGELSERFGIGVHDVFQKAAIAVYGSLAFDSAGLVDYKQAIFLLHVFTKKGCRTGGAS